MGDAVVQIVDGIATVVQIVGRQGPPGPAGVTFFDVRENGYGGEAMPGAELKVLDVSAHADIELMPGTNYIALNCGGACALTLTPSGSAMTYEVLNVDGSSSAAVTWG